MKYIVIPFLIASALICTVSCGNHSNGKPNHTSPANTDTVSQQNTVIVPERDTICHYRFLDFRHNGSKESFLKGIRYSKIFNLHDSSNVVSFLGADWGLNIETDSLERVSNVTLITSNTSHEIFNRASTDLHYFFEKPWLYEPTEQIIQWSSYFCSAHLRYLHTDEGGWTIIFSLSYQESWKNALTEEQITAVRTFQEDVRSGDHDKIASHFNFPFDIGYPLPDIKNKDDFLARYDLLFDKYIEEDIVFSNNWSHIGWHRGIACNSGNLLWGDVDSTLFVITAFNTHTEAYYKAWQKEVDAQRRRVHPSLRGYTRPVVVARSGSCIFRVDEVPDGILRLALWNKGKTMMDRPDYVNQDGFQCQEGSIGYPDWQFVNGKDTIDICYSYEEGKGYYCLHRYSDGNTLMDIKTTDYED